MKAGTQQLRGADDRNLGSHQFGGKIVLFLDLRIAPAPGSVELGDDGAAVFQLHLVHPVFVRREGSQAAVAAQADAVERVKDQVGRQGFEGMRHAPIVVGCGKLRSRTRTARRFPGRNGGGFAAARVRRFLPAARMAFPA